MGAYKDKNGTWFASARNKRGGGEVTLALDELEECVSENGSIKDEMLRQGPNNTT